MCQVMYKIPLLEGNLQVLKVQLAQGVYADHNLLFRHQVYLEWVCRDMTLQISFSICQYQTACIP